MDGVYHTGHIPVITKIFSIMQLYQLFKLEQNSMMVARNCWYVVLEVLPKGKGNCIYLPISHTCVKAATQTFNCIIFGGNNNQ